jgi:hypothetical protein
MTGHVIKSRAMTIRRRVPERAAAVTIVISVALLLSLAPRAHFLAQASASRPITVISATSMAPTEVSTASGQQQNDGNDQDVLPKALLTVGIAAAAGVVALIGYLIRKRIGFWPHRPQPQDPSSEEHH